MTTFNITPESVHDFLENNKSRFYDCDIETFEDFVNNEQFIECIYDDKQQKLTFTDGNGNESCFSRGYADFKFLVENLIFGRNDMQYSSEAKDINALFESIRSENTKTTTQNNERKEDNSTMNITMPNFDFGKVTNGSVINSYMGLAIRNKESRYVNYNSATGDITDVTGMEINLGEFIYKMPVALKDIAIGDLIINNGTPMYVKKINGNSIEAIDITVNEIKTIVPVKNIFGFDFVTKIVSMLNFDNFDADESNPFGSSMLPFLLMGNSDGKGGKANDMLPFLMMSGGKMDMSNPMTMMMLMGDGKMGDILPMMMMMGNNPFAPKAKE